MKVEAFILVGGRSTRLGRDKALERIGGKTLAERALNTVQDSLIASKIYFVTGNQIGFAIEAERLDTPFVFDVIAGRGPPGGLYTALTHATTDWIFVLACDLQFVTQGLLNCLSAFMSDQFGAVVPEQPDGRLQPLCAFYNVKITKPVVDEIIHRPRVSPPMHEVVGLLNPRIVRPIEYNPWTAPSAVYFANVNTEEDLEQAREIERKLLDGAET